MFEILFQLVGGIGILMYGIEVMKDALERTTAGRPQKMLEASANPLTGILMGTLVTVINQKSSITTVAAVSLVNTGILTLVQAGGVIMGANIGTTVTGQILAFQLELEAPFIVGISVFLWRFARNKKVNDFAEIFLGFGLMFVGMIFLTNAMDLIRLLPEVPGYLSLIGSLTPMEYGIAMAAGFAATFLIKSSSVFTGVLIAMASDGLLNFPVAMALILGMNIGKCILPLLASYKASRNARKAALLHLIFNSIGALVFLLFFRSLMQDAVTLLAPQDLARQLAHAHTIFNLGTTILCAPLLPFLVILADKLVPMRIEELKQGPQSLDVRMLETPGIAMAQAQHEINEMAAYAFRNYQNSFSNLGKGSESQAMRSQEDEDQITRKQKEIETYLVKLSQKPITEDQHENLNLMLGVTSDIEQISEMAVQISNLAVQIRSQDIHLSDDCLTEIQGVNLKISVTAEKLMKALLTNDPELASSLFSIENRIRNKEDELRESHVERLSSGVCQPGAGPAFMDLLSCLVHVAEHMKKIAQFIVESSKY